jgi:hypothetical protein
MKEAMGELSCTLSPTCRFMNIILINWISSRRFREYPKTLVMHVFLFSNTFAHQQRTSLWVKNTSAVTIDEQTSNRFPTIIRSSSTADETEVLLVGSSIRCSMQNLGCSS